MPVKNNPKVLLLQTNQDLEETKQSGDELVYREKAKSQELLIERDREDKSSLDDLISQTKALQKMHFDHQQLIIKM